MSGASLLSLEWYAEGVTPSEPVVLCGTCAMGQKTAQNAGRAFWDKFEAPYCTATVETGEDEKTGKNQDSGLNEREKMFKEKKAKREREQKERDGGLLKISEDLKGKDLYELLEMDGSFGPEDIKKAYRKLVLVHHPDKMTDPTEEQKKHFLLIQEAFDILSDPVKKRRYESTLKFDDDIPSDLRKGYADNFFEVFAPVFKRNARWSEKPRVPELGDADTPIEKVKEFYEFWHNFESWRDPLAIAEQDEVELHNLEEAECREEKRWMERENAKVARKIKAGERERVADLTKHSEKHDPRMIAHRAQLAADKDAAKAHKAAAADAEKAKLQEEARVKAEAEEAARLVADEKKQADRKAKDDQKNALKGARQRVRNLHKNADAVVRHAVHIDQLQEVCLRLGTDELLELATELEAALEKKSEDGCEAVELLHGEIKKGGATPIEDDSVQLKPEAEVDSASTATPNSDTEEEKAQEEPLGSPCADKIATLEETEAERADAEAREAEELAAREKKAEEQRKKREQKKREEEKREVAQRRAEAAQRAKQRKAEEKVATKEAEKVVEETAAPEAQPEKADTGISKNTILVVMEEGTVFKSPDSAEEISTIAEGSLLVASGPPVEVDGFDMVPLQPCGSVELRIVRLMQAAAAVAVEESAEEAAPAVKVEAKKAPTAAKARAQTQEEDLDGLLEEFGVVLDTTVTIKSSKKKGKR